jgi:serine/threonine-protein kinase
VYRCLEKKREDRFRSTQSLVIALERFLSRRCEMNYRARLVLYLRDLGVMEAEEAGRYLHPAVAGGYARGDAQSTLRGGALRRLLAVEGGTLVGMALAASLLHLSPIGVPKVAARPAPVAVPPVEKPGFLQVIVDPWARIYLDGESVDVTPLPKPLVVPAGKHRLELRNDYLRYTETREIRIEPGAVLTVRTVVKQ